MSADRDCTCIGACCGAGSLAPGWRCALAASLVHVDVAALVDRAKLAYASAALSSLGQQLTIAAALTRAFRAGFDAGFGVTGEGFNGEYAPRLTADGYARMLDEVSTWSGDWRPGCGKEAP